MGVAFANVTVGAPSKTTDAVEGTAASVSNAAAAFEQTARTATEVLNTKGTSIASRVEQVTGGVADWVQNITETIGTQVPVLLNEIGTFEFYRCAIVVGISLIMLLGALRVPRDRDDQLGAVARWVLLILGFYLGANAALDMSQLLYAPESYMLEYLLHLR